MGSELDCFTLFLAHMIRHKVTFALYILLFSDKIIRKKASGKKVVSRQDQLNWPLHHRGKGMLAQLLLHASCFNTPVFVSPTADLTRYLTAPQVIEKALLHYKSVKFYNNLEAKAFITPEGL